eukprot:TRINITY_DN34225_c0_g1_i1.p1 TRINITY_DN34225_c0_g1~~TRINITY_DN34225_c0_g1_i1.p1  ORF type:complete len:145 (-),score=16.60 TRINITY_DN34225_c0_g1_i1:66-500(-)
MLIWNSTDEAFSKRRKQEKLLPQLQNLNRKPEIIKKNYFNVSSCFRNTGVVPVPCRIQTNNCVPLPSRHPPIPKIPKINLPPLQKAYTYTETLPMEEIEVMPNWKKSASKSTTSFHAKTQEKMVITIEKEPKVVQTYNFYAHRN